MPKAVAIHNIDPCPNCGYVAKQPFHQKRHLEICTQLPPLEQVATEIREITLAGVARKYSTPRRRVTETFLRRLMITNGYPTVKEGDLFDDGSWKEEWCLTGQQCAKCGILTAQTADGVPEQIELDPTLLVAVPLQWTLDEKVTANWQIRKPGVGDVICQMCANEKVQ